MKPIEQFMETYVELETAVRELMTRLFSSTCGICTVCCCRVDICEEALASPFLSQLLERQDRSANNLDDRFGWLDLHGCTLEYGKPPVCYTFFCDELLARLPDDETRHVTRVLGRLMEYIGEDALDGWHLVEIAKASDLEHVDFEALSLRLDEARTAFEAIEHFAETGRLSSDERKAIEVITLTED